MWTRAQLLNFSHAVFTAEFVKGRKVVTYKFLFYIGKKQLIFVKKGYVRIFRNCFVA
jgi:hypothetical protein